MIPPDQSALCDHSVWMLRIQPVLKPVVQPVWQPAVSCKQTPNWLSNLFSNRFDNRLDVCLHDTAGCQTGCQTGCTTGLTTCWTNNHCSFNRLSNRLSNPFDNRLNVCISLHDTTGCQPVWQQVVSCKGGFRDKWDCCSCCCRVLWCSATCHYYTRHAECERNKNTCNRRRRTSASCALSSSVFWFHSHTAVLLEKHFVSYFMNNKLSDLGHPTDNCLLLQSMQAVSCVIVAYCAVMTRISVYSTR